MNTTETAMSMARWRERLGGRDSPDRFRHYTLSSITLFALFEAGLWAFWVAMVDAGPAWLALVAALVAAHVILQALLNRAALCHYLGAAPCPRRLVALYTAVTVTVVALGCVLLATGRIEDREATPYLLWMLMYYAGPPVLALPRRTGAVLVTAVTLATIGAATASGLTGYLLVLVGGGGLLLVPLVAVAFRFSGWSVRHVEELAAARETEARLAVAEERLRFGRDLHDVLGRNLAVVALKSELAAQLARRGREEAVDEMVEVQRIAQESQREIRAVVRGYRTADLHTELVGARSVLEAAGIACRIENGPAGRLPTDVQSALGWVVREGTTNVLRHASGASRCEVSVRATGSGSVVLVMENDGAGAEPSAAGAGLPGLRERLADLDGTLSTEQRPDGAFRLTARIPGEAPA
ncbi:sensor histidine kinase [Streptomyces pinistramenti]|uniref:sensor histidine kinase n=1 Tax=Streptomyces pinistramenti TaxID=2884812 RepID=UPI001D08DBC3|nr:sensor histidine kinase [Streptomyces pinistramenti]MCB5907722.1 sensor histidine kinase [Streptomyces pinistramenti]